MRKSDTYRGARRNIMRERHMLSQWREQISVWNTLMRHRVKHKHFVPTPTRSQRHVKLAEAA